MGTVDLIVTTYPWLAVVLAVLVTFVVVEVWLALHR